MDSVSKLIARAKDKANKHTIDRQTPINNVESSSTLLDSYYIAQHIRDYIEVNMSYIMRQTFIIHKKHITVNIYSPKSISKTYMKQALAILYLLIPHSPASCSQELSIYIYLTPFKKEFPERGEILGPEHINSGVTWSCKRHSEVLVFREEEWFKVYIHELFHNLGLDFSQHSITYFKRELKKLHSISSEFLLYEAYCECWATIIQLIYLNKDPVREIRHSICQTKRIIQFNDEYREKTNVFCYYFIKAVFLSDMEYFIKWCKQHNHTLFRYAYNPSNNKAFITLYKTLLPDFMDDLRVVACNRVKSLRMTYKN